MRVFDGKFRVFSNCELCFVCANADCEFVKITLKTSITQHSTKKSAERIIANFEEIFGFLDFFDFGIKKLYTLCQKKSCRPGVAAAGLIVVKRDAAEFCPSATGTKIR